jgi:hypothetical protein
MQLIVAIKGAIASAGYQSNQVSVTMEGGVAGLVIMPANYLSRAISNVSSGTTPADVSQLYMHYCGSL